MSSHQILPSIQHLLPDLANVPPLNVRADSLHSRRIMTEPRAQLPEHPEPQSRARSQAPPVLGQHTAPVSAESSSNLRSDGFRISRRRTYTYSDVFQDTDKTPEAFQRSPPPELERRDSCSLNDHHNFLSNLCLCQPDPKVPRPRNSFILFRQHHQAEVAKSNPELTNPEISKIIGEYWRQLTPESKETWRNLAEEEKARHQKQYPDYRYQPKRAGRGSQVTSSSTDSEVDKCLKCGGRSLQGRRSSPVRPADNPAMIPVRAAATRVQRPSPPSIALVPQEALAHYPDSPSSAALSSNQSHEAQGYGILAFNANGRHGGLLSPLVSPDAKRRRVDSVVTRSQPARHSGINRSVSNQHYPGRAFSSAPLARTEQFSKQPSFSQHRSQHSPTQAGIKLAPISVGNHSSQSKSVEAMVMSIAALKKIRTLAKIAKPLPMPGAASPSHATRGAIIAVEGTDDDALKTVITHIRNRLQQGNEHTVKLYYGGSFASMDEAPTFAEWLKVIQSWHGDAEEVVSFITSPPAPTPQRSPISEVSPKSRSQDIGARAIDPHNGIASDHAAAMAPNDKRASNIEGGTGVDWAGRKRKTLESEPVRTRPPIPVAMIPRYQLTLTDVAASFVPISDSYSPADHWQWMAATWRGIPGPDITIVVRPHASEEAGEGRIKASDVEVRLADFHTVILRHEKGGKVAESSLRRVGFEVEEWLRGMNERTWMDAQDHRGDTNI